jgi:hypothetical protein
VAIGDTVDNSLPPGGYLNETLSALVTLQLSLAL